MKISVLQNYQMLSWQIRIKQNGFFYGHGHYANFKRLEHPMLGVTLDNSCIKLDAFFPIHFPPYFQLLIGLTTPGKLRDNFSESGDPILLSIAVMRKKKFA